MSATITPKQNILYLLADDQRYDMIGVLGNQHIHTPYMDTIFQEGTAFDHAFITGGTCGVVCRPSRAMIHTGRELFSF